MNSLGKMLVTGCFVLSGNIFASMGPVDLEDLERRWGRVQKTDDASLLMSLEHVDVLDDEQQSLSILSNEISNSNIEDKGRELESVVFKQYKEDVQDSVMKSLFSRSFKKVSFCQAYENLDVPNIEAKEGEEELTEEERAKRHERFMLTSCKKKTAEMMSGILFADPQVYLVEKNFIASNTKIIVLYVKSLVDSSKFLRYVYTL